MTPFTLVSRNVRRRKMRLFLSLLAIIVAFLIFGLMSAIRQNFSLGTTSENSTRLIVFNKVGELDDLPINYLGRVRDTPGVSQASARVLVPAYFRDRKNVFLTLAVEPKSYLEVYSDYTLSPEERDAFLSNQNSILVGQSLAERHGWTLGDTVPLMLRPSLRSDAEISRSFKIAGIFKPANSDVGTGLALIHFAPFNEARIIGKDTVGSIVVRTSIATANDRIGALLDRKFENSAFETSTMTEEAFSRALVSQIGDITLITTAVSAAGFFVILLVVGSAMSSSIRERSREIGIMRVLGFSSETILHVLIGEALLISAIGGSIGILLAGVAVNLLRAADGGSFGRMALTPATLIGSLILMLVFGFAVAILPAMRSLRTDVTTALVRR